MIRFYDVLFTMYFQLYFFLHAFAPVSQISTFSSLSHNTLPPFWNNPEEPITAQNVIMLLIQRFPYLQKKFERPNGVDTVFESLQQHTQAVLNQFDTYFKDKYIREGWEQVWPSSCFLHHFGFTRYWKRRWHKGTT